jgi:hypothetical protein
MEKEKAGSINGTGIFGYPHNQYFRKPNFT